MADLKAAAREAAPLILRLALGAIFVFHGAQKLGLLDPARSWDTTAAAVNGFAATLGTLGLEPAVPLAWATALTEFLGGAFLVLGFATRAAAAAIVAVMAVAIHGVHWAVGFGPERLATGGVRPGYEFNLALIAAALALVLLGSGAMGLDALLKKFRDSRKKGERL